MHRLLLCKKLQIVVVILDLLTGLFDSLLLYFHKPLAEVEPGITFAPRGVAILSNHTVYNLRFAFLTPQLGVNIVSKRPFEREFRDCSR